ncbi:hypothetical protein [Thermodesulfitimonas autotrophica]|uniref:hypothetical protein n=1 Tax=Thermodesulfitimonas autotrophica TaxID=1894989 RepID=UPI000F4EF905|nr:hypothetical protein [Thermodesulfitimonas autotrophica]
MSASETERERTAQNKSGKKNNKRRRRHSIADFGQKMPGFGGKNGEAVWGAAPSGGLPYSAAGWPTPGKEETDNTV